MSCCFLFFLFTGVWRCRDACTGSENGKWRTGTGYGSMMMVTCLWGGGLGLGLLLRLISTRGLSAISTTSDADTNTIYRCLCRYIWHIAKDRLGEWGWQSGWEFIYWFVEVFRSLAPLFRPRYQLNQLRLSSGTFADRLPLLDIASYRSYRYRYHRCVWVAVGCGSNGVPSAALCTWLRVL